ncbi:MAG: hypothetical protein H6701_06330 [Myxococcales bacterium]|nr:hypothetical protein [Myxococcales bacterium]
MRWALCVAVLLAGCYEDNEAEPEGGADAAVGICAPGEARCDVEGRLRTCLDDGLGWLVEPCAAGAMCTDGACVGTVCDPGERRCGEGGVERCAADGSGFAAPVACPAETSCVEGVCLARSCMPGETACGEGARLTCAADGLSWVRDECAAGEVCVDGACGAPVADCVAGEVLCSRTAVIECGEDGARVERPCRPGEVCFGGACIACVRDGDCPMGRACVDGACVAPPLVVVTEALAPAQVGVAYAATLEAANGAPDYTWRLAEGMLPRGLGLDAAGQIAGTPTRAEEATIIVEVGDTAGATATAELTLRVLGDGLQVATETLPAGEEGVAYAAALEAIGGQPPYGWLIVDGALPEGLVLTADGGITGVPSAIGPFPLRVRVVDAGTPPQAAEADLVLNVTVAPLEIVPPPGMELDLFFTRIITLPTLTIVPGLPAFYDTRLEARGGLRPYTWAETPIPAELRPFVQGAGLPDGLVLAPDGRLSGVLEDPSQQIELEIPFTGIVLTGFFFTAEVRDSQNPADTDSAIFSLPTLDLGQ